MRRSLPVIESGAASDGARTEAGVRAAPSASASRWAGLETAPLASDARPSGDGRHLPHVVAWNLTRRCNLACAHCYIAAGSWHAAANELSTAECRRIIDEIFATHRRAASGEYAAATADATTSDAADPADADGPTHLASDGPAAHHAPAPFFILSGGEPLLRDDLEEIAAYATDRGATVVVGTNGTRLTRERIRSLKRAGVTGVAISVDSLDPTYHDRFRHGAGALDDTLAAVERLGEERLDFVVQTTLTRGNRHELPDLVGWAADRGAVSFNLYFLVATGRGEGMRGLSPEENDEVLAELVELERAHRGRMMIRSKCQPQIMRHAHEAGDDSPLLNYGTRCPCGVHYCRITPEGKVTPCPYMPAVAGDLRTHRFDEVWFGSPVFTDLRAAADGGTAGTTDGAALAADVRRASGPDAGVDDDDAGAAAGGGGVRVTMGGKCGRCEYRVVCGGCRARAFADTGDYLGP
ncbi:MAG: radical SAM protein, partial [Gemmatimonadota bacterium]